MGIATPCRAAMGIARRLGALSPACQIRLEGQPAEVGPLQRPSLIFVTGLQATFRSSTGSSRSGARSRELDSGLYPPQYPGNIPLRPYSL
jgi:hypothetical protein